MFLASPGQGKSWLLENSACYANIFHGACVLIITSEMTVESWAERILLTAHKHTSHSSDKREVPRVELLLDNKGVFSGTERKTSSVGIAAKDLHRRLEHMAKTRPPIIIRHLPSSLMTSSHIASVMDDVQSRHKVCIDMVVVDYLGLMNVPDPGSRTYTLGKHAQELHELAVVRSAAVVSAQQLRRDLAVPGHARAGDAAHCHELHHHVDNLFVLNQTETERALGISRLFLEKQRLPKNAEVLSDHVEALMASGLQTGWISTSSVLLNARGSVVLDAMLGGDEQDDDAPRKRSRRA
jgi:hypothetical protein